jgi:hypothetical protein
LYNAVIRAELDVTMRYNHSMLVTYVDPSDDAAIASGLKDFQFVNNLEYPVYIEGYCSNGVITMNIYGYETRPSNRVISFESEILSQVDPQVTYTLSNDYDAGYWKVMQSEHRGTEARLWKVVTVDGVEESREVFNTSSYRESPKEVTIGTKGGSEAWLKELKAAISGGSDEATVKALATSPTTEEEVTEAAEATEATEATEDTSDKTSKDKTSKDKTSKDKTSKDKTSNDETTKDKTSDKNNSEKSEDKEKDTTEDTKNKQEETTDSTSSETSAETTEETPQETTTDTSAETTTDTTEAPAESSSEGSSDGGE